RDGMDPAAYYAGLAEIGFSAVEIAAPERWPLARAAGLELLNLAAPGIEQGLCRADDHPRLLPLIRETIAAAGEAGIPQVIVFSGRGDGVDEAAGREACVRALDALAADAADASVLLTFELLNAVDHPGYLACSTDFVFDVVARVDAPSVRALYD